MSPKKKPIQTLDNSSFNSGTADTSFDHSSVEGLISDSQWRRLKFVVLILYACVQVLYITTTPFQMVMLPENLPHSRTQTASQDVVLVGIGPDEAAHFLYILSLAKQGRLPAPDPARRTSPQQYVTYQAQHPPLFYAMGAILYKVAAGLPPLVIWNLLRGFCAVCGAIVILLTAEATRTSFPDRPFLALAMVPAVAFLPMFGYMTATLSNEPLEMVFGVWTWLQLARLAREKTPCTVLSCALLGLTLGIAALTRFTALLWILPAAIVLGHCVQRSRRLKAISLRRALVPILAFALCFGLLVAPWLIRNLLVFGSPIIRPQYRPMLENISLIHFFFSPAFFSTAGQTALWYASTAWLPFWLTQFEMPGGLPAAPLWQSLFLAFDVLALLLLLRHNLRVRHHPKRQDATGRILLWAAFSAVAFCVLTLLQQQFFIDWQVVFYGGRYLADAAPASLLLLLTALFSSIPPSGRRLKATTVGIAVFMLAFDLYTIGLLRQYYATHPYQVSVQRL
jgi:hypothetical protein